MFSIICFAVAEDLPNPSNLCRFNPKAAQLELMMIALHKREGDFSRRPGESFFPGKGWALPSYAVQYSEAQRHDMAPPKVPKHWNHR